MCLLILAIQAHPAYKLIIAANRDEFYERHTSPAGFWDKRPHILAGRDLRGRGTWLGITRTGRIGAITNYRDPTSFKPNAPSRGKLVTDFLSGNKDPEAYLREVDLKAKKSYNGFNLVVGMEDRLFWYSNRGHGIQRIARGIHGLSNHLLDTPWPKVSRAKAALERTLRDASHIAPETLLEILLDRTIPQDRSLPDTGVGIELERMLSPIFIAGTDYGTRSSTVILMDHEARVTFLERTHGSSPCPLSDVVFEFEIEG
jgi:uncharacterized protein with NRDE domain